MEKGGFPINIIYILLNTASTHCEFVGGSSKGDLLGEQNETGSEGELSEHIRPTVFGRFRRCGDDPELASWMVDDRDGAALCGADGPTAAQEVYLVVGVEPAREVESKVEVEKAGIWTSAHGVSAF